MHWFVLSQRFDAYDVVFHHSKVVVVVVSGNSVNDHTVSMKLQVCVGIAVKDSSLVTSVLIV